MVEVRPLILRASCKYRSVPLELVSRCAECLQISPGLTQSGTLYPPATLPGRVLATWAHRRGGSSGRRCKTGREMGNAAGSDRKEQGRGARGASRAGPGARERPVTLLTHTQPRVPARTPAPPFALGRPCRPACPSPEPALVSPPSPHPLPVYQAAISEGKNTQCAVQTAPLPPKWAIVSTPNTP